MKKKKSRRTLAKADSPAEPAFPGRKVIGWREWLALPQLKIKAIKAKIDSGARTSTLHATHIEKFQRHGRSMVRFYVYPHLHQPKKGHLLECELFDHRAIRSSNGSVEHRPIIITDIEIMGICWPIELSLTNRGLMGFDLLLGREALKKNFLIHPGRSFLAGHSDH